MTTNNEATLDVKIIPLTAAKSLLTKLQKEDYMQFFHVEFVKRTPPHEYRKMNCRYGVTKHLAGGKKSFNDAEYQLKTVWDKDKGEYRSIALEGIVKMKIKGQVYHIEENLKHLPKE